MAASADFFLDFAVAAAVGGLIGVERENSVEKGTVVAGVRTFPLVSISGFLVAFLAQESGSALVLAGGVVGSIAIALMFVHARASLGIIGFTSPVAMIVTFLLGAAIGYGYAFEAVVVGVVATFLLLTKERLHRFAQYLDEREILSALQFMAVAFILLPLTAQLQAPVAGQDWLGRGALVDPFVILTVVVFVSSISFASLLVMRQVGPRRGLEFSGLLGGLVNSEATTASLAHRAKESRVLVGAAVVGALLASATMVVRNLAIAAFADPGLAFVRGLLPYVLPAALVGALLAWRVRGGRNEPVPAVRVKNPFAVLPALQFALVFATVSIVAKVATTYLGESGVYVTALGGFVSAGAVVASLAGLVANGTVPLRVAVVTGAAAIAASVLGKLAILRAIDHETERRARVPFVLMSVVALAGAAAAFVLA